MPRSFCPIPLRPHATLHRRLLHSLIAVATLLVRLYLASIWFRFGAAKLESGWLATNPAQGLLRAVAAGHTPMPIPSLSTVAGWLLAVRADPVLSVVLPLAEVTLGAAFVAGICVRLAAAGAIAINTSLILGGLASVAFDGRFIALEATLLLAGPRAGDLGLPGVLRLMRDRWCATRRVAPAPGPEPRRKAA